MSYLLAIFLPPIYLLTRKRYLAATFGLILFLLSIAMYVTIFLFWVGIIFYLIALMHACWHLRKQVVEESASVLADKMAAAFAQKTILGEVRPQDDTPRPRRTPEQLPAPAPSPELPEPVVKAAVAGKELEPVVLATPIAEFCDECGARLESASRFCDECGTAVSHEGVVGRPA